MLLIVDSITHTASTTMLVNVSPLGHVWFGVEANEREVQTVPR